VSTLLAQIAEKTYRDRKACFTSLAHLLTPEFLRETWKTMNRHGAGGVDTKAVARVLEMIFEVDFCDVSYGYRPGRNPHHALQALREQVVTKKVSYVFEADIRGYFNHVSHSWLQRMVQERIADPVILSLIGQWLNAGAMQHGVVVWSEEGTPQGGPISCILANIYLHFVLDLWFDRKEKLQFRGEAHMVRFVDDFVVSFQYRTDAEDFHRRLRERFAQFNLELAEEKTRLLLFGRFARERSAQRGQKPETFDFLGFKHVCGVDRNGKFAVIRLPSIKSCQKFLARKVSIVHFPAAINRLRRPDHGSCAASHSAEDQCQRLARGRCRLSVEHHP
jgi:group II intron reverse transcriptase/maturase